MGRDLDQEIGMNCRSGSKLVRGGNYVAEVPVTFIEDDTGWSPYLSPNDAYRLDEVREALRVGDVATAARVARVFRLAPVEA
jgi:hypothetical protein